MNVLRGQGALPERRVLSGGKGTSEEKTLAEEAESWGDHRGRAGGERGSGRPRGEARGGAAGDKGSPGGKGWGENVEGQVEVLGLEAESREWANSQSQGEAERELGRSWGGSGQRGSQARGSEG